MTERIEKLLKQRRLDKQLTLDDITRDLKIRKDYIKQFEKKIPEPLGVYELGYLRCYAKYLEIDINDYIIALKAKANDVNQEKKSQFENKVFGIFKTASGKLTITFSIVGVLASVIFLIAVNKGYLKGINNYKKSSKEILDTSANVSGGNNTVVNISANSSVKQKGPYDYLINNINNDVDIKIIARVNTTFTMIDPIQNKVLRSGTILTGEELFIPKKQGSSIFTSLLIKTNVPNAFDISNHIQGN